VSVIGVGTVLVDFDGTACAHDVAEHLLVAFGEDDWPGYDAMWDRGEISGRDAIGAQASMVTGTTAELTAFALGHCPMDPTFGPFVDWLRSVNVPMAVVSDGFGFYIDPLLDHAGIEDVDVITNRWDEDADGPARMSFPNGHPECVGCGTCKMQAVLLYRARHGPVAFIGEGASDRFGALYADIVFAKEDLPAYCRADGVPFVAWNDFDDVRRALERGTDLPGAVSPVRCPGWMLPSN
jgi:2-hydroxy-3-keto-5-methylthiopentenyl-1-phosphate phosphatase